MNVRCVRPTKRGRSQFLSHIGLSCWVSTLIYCLNTLTDGILSYILNATMRSQPHRWGTKVDRGRHSSSSFVHHFTAIGEFKLELQSGNSQLWSNSTIFLAVWPWNLTDDLQKQYGTSPKQHQALCITSSSYVNSNWSYSLETAKLGYDFYDLDLWPWTFAWTSLLSLVITPENFVMIRWWEHSQKGVMDRDRRTDRQTDRTIHRAAWSQLKKIGYLFYAVSSFVHHFIAISKFKLELQSGNG